MQTRWSRLGRHVLLGSRTHEVAGRQAKTGLAVDADSPGIVLSVNGHDSDGNPITATVRFSGDEARRLGVALIESGAVLDAETSGLWSQR